MKNWKSLTAIILVCLMVGFVKAQRMQQNFSKIIFVTYHFTGAGEKTGVAIEELIEVRQNGFVRCVRNGYNNVSFSGEGTDTTYLAPDSLMNLLNASFNINNKLIKHVVTDKIEGRYGGSLEFISCTFDNNVIDNLSMIPNFLDHPFRDVLKKVWYLPQGTKWNKSKVYQNKRLESFILQSYRSGPIAIQPKSPPLKKSL